MEFHVWDFSKLIEVRLSDDCIETIRNMTVKKRVQVRTKPYLGPGWKESRAVNKVMEIKVKFIALREGHPYHKIAERLYPKVDHHGPGREAVPHKPFLTIKELLTVHKVTGIPLEELERSVIAVRNFWAGKEIPMKFPVVANKDWAWLLGLYFSCGGQINRFRVWAKDGHPVEEIEVRFTVDAPVFNQKVKPILARMGYVPNLSTVWYVKKGLRHPLDRNRRRGVGNQPKRFFILLRPIREIMEKFGLPGLPSNVPTKTSKKSRGYSRYSARRYGLSIPSWIREDSKFSHAFIEGFLNGGQIASDFSVRPKDVGVSFLKRTVELRFASFNQGEVESFTQFFKTRLEEIGITGYVHRGLHKKTSKACWIGFLIHNTQCLRRLYESFDIRKPDLRARLRVNYQLNPLLYEICKNLDSSEILVLGALLDQPLSNENLASSFRMNPVNVEKALERLERFGLTELIGNGIWKFSAEMAVLNPSLSKEFEVMSLL